MDISSASRKVLCTALSAATAFAFAPAMALGLTADEGKVTVEFEAGDGTGSLDPHTYTADENGAITLSASGADIANAFTNGDYAFAGFYYDADADGVKDDGESVVEAGSLSAATGIFADVEDGSTVKLVAYYNAPVASLTLGDVEQTAPTEGTAFTVGALENLVASHTYAYTIEKDGAVIYTSNDFTGSASSASDAIEWTDDSSQAIQGSKKISNVAWGAGSFTLTVTDKTAGKSWSDTKNVLTATFDATDDGYFSEDADNGVYVRTEAVLFAQGAKAADVVELAGDPNDLGFRFSGWTLNGKAVSEDDALDADTTFVASYAVPQIASASFSADDKKITFTAANLVTKSDDANIQSYNVAIAGPNGLSANYDLADASENQAVELLFDQTVTGYEGADYKTAASVASGEYSITLTPQYAESYEGAKAEAVSGSISIVALTLDANGGKIGEEDSETLYAAAGESTYTDLINSAGAELDGQDFKGWSVDGTVEGIVNAEDVVSADVTLLAVWEATPATQFVAPSYEVADAGDGKFTISASAEDGAIVQYSTDGAEGTYYTLQSTGLTTNAAKVYLKAVSAGESSLTESDVVTLDASIEAVSAYDELFDAIVGSNVEDPIAPLKENAGTPTHQAYSYVYAATKTAGEDALKAVGYATDAEWNKAVNAQLVADVQTIVADANAYLDTLGAGVEQEDGSVVKASAADVEAAQSKLAAVVEASQAAQATADESAATLTVADAFKAAAVAEAVKSVSTTTYSADDAAAAAAVNDAVAALPALEEVTAENYEQAAVDAQAAIDAFNALTETQKELVTASGTYAYQVKVAAAEVKVAVVQEQAAAAQAAANAAAAQAQDELIVAQDKLALSKAAAKTVKANSKKKVTASFKSATSASGSVLTYSKKSGNAKIKIAKGGKITVKKGLKKGKKYTVKVKAVCGAQSKTIKVTVKVVK